MNELGWGNPDAIIYGAVSLSLLVGFIWLGSWRRDRLKALADTGPLARLIQERAAGGFFLRAILVTFASGLIVLALMRPQYGTRATEMNNLGIDIAVVLDASKSMMVADVVPDRLRAAKLELHKLLAGLNGGRVGLVPFAGLAFVQTPLTSDFDVITTYLDDLRVEDMPRGGTAIGRALVEALRALVPPEKLEGTLAETATEASEADREVTFDGAKHKAIVLLTDGEGHEGDPLAVAELAAKLGIRIYTVGVGTAQGRPVPIINDEGQVMGTMKAADGKTPMFSELNEGLLRDIADRTGGGYFNLGPTGELTGLARAIDGLEKQEYEATFKNLRDDRYQLALWPALLFLLFEALLVGHRRRR